MNVESINLARSIRSSLSAIFTDLNYIIPGIPIREFRRINRNGGFEGCAYPSLAIVTNRHGIRS